MKARRGFTLIELMVSITIMMLAVIAATAVSLEGSTMTRNANDAAQETDAARLAMETIVKSLRIAGGGAPAGVWVNVGGVPTKVGALFGLDGTTGVGGTPQAPTATQTDDLWMVVPDINALRESCVDPGAATAVVNSGTGILQVLCTASFAANDTLFVTNMTSAALITKVALTPPQNNPPTPGLIDYAERVVAGFSDAPEKGGYQVGDMVHRASIVHFYIARDARTGQPALYQAQGQLGPDLLGRPFVDVPGSGYLVQTYIEDLQLAFGFDLSGSGDPNQYSWQNGLDPSATAGFGLRSIRVNVVALSQRQVMDTKGSYVTGPSYAPLTVENHVSAGIVDSYRRSLYTRRIELPNMAPLNL